MARFKRKDPLTYERDAYRYADAVREAIPNPLKEYARIRAAAMNRIRKLERAGYEKSETVKKARQVFEKTARQMSNEEAIQALPAAARFITSARGTVGGMREIERKMAETMQDRGIDFVTPKNAKAFGEFLDWLGTDKLEKQFYEAVSGAPREGRSSKEKRLKLSSLQSAFKAWAEANDYKI
jgi:hypothetical protein